MSYSITLQVGMDGAAEIVSTSTGAAAPPPGTYTIGGHVPTDDAPTGSVSCTTPTGGVSGFVIG